MRLSNQFVLKYVKSDAAPHGVADPQLLLDYRCYVGGKEVLGTDYPPQVVSCLKKISGMSVKEVGSEWPGGTGGRSGGAMGERGGEGRRDGGRRCTETLCLCDVVLTSVM